MLRQLSWSSVLEPFRERVISVTLGFVLAWASIFIVGFGSAVALPANGLKVLLQFSELLTFALVDMVTIAIPMTLAYCVTAVLGKWLVKTADWLYYALLLTPLLVLQGHFLLQIPDQQLQAFITILPRFVLLGLAFYLLTRRLFRTDSSTL